MINSKTHKICDDSECDNEFRMYKSTDKYCSYSCKKKNTKPKSKKAYKIPQVSKKQAKLLGRYFKIRADFMNDLDSQICPVYNHKHVTDVHHKKGKEGYADDWARDNYIPLLLDVRFFLAVSREGHDYIEKNPVWAKDMGFSLDRLSN